MSEQQQQTAATAIKEAPLINEPAQIQIPPTHDAQGQIINEEPSVLDDSVLILHPAAAASAASAASTTVGNSKLCEECADTTLASHYCNECKSLLCDFHVEHHRRSKSMRLHTLLPLTDVQTTSPVKTPVKAEIYVQFCLEHKFKMLFAFCDNCSQAICEECAVSSHQSHRFLKIDQAKEKYANLIRQDSSVLNKRLEKLTAALRELESLQTSLEDRQNTLASNITSVFNELIADIEEKIRMLNNIRQSLQARLDLLVDSVKKEITADVQAIKEQHLSLTNSKQTIEHACTQAALTLSQPAEMSPLELVQHYIDVAEGLEMMKTEELAMTPSVRDSLRFSFPADPTLVEIDELGTLQRKEPNQDASRHRAKRIKTTSTPEKPSSQSSDEDKPLRLRSQTQSSKSKSKQSDSSEPRDKTLAHETVRTEIRWSNPDPRPQRQAAVNARSKFDFGESPDTPKRRDPRFEPPLFVSPTKSLKLSDEIVVDTNASHRSTSKSVSSSPQQQKVISRALFKTSSPRGPSHLGVKKLLENDVMDLDEHFQKEEAYEEVVQMAHAVRDYASIKKPSAIWQPDAWQGFARSRRFGLAILSEGKLAVMNILTPGIQLFSLEGKFERTILTNIERTNTCDISAGNHNTIWILEYNANNVSQYSVTGGLRQKVTISRPIYMRQLPDDRFVIASEARLIMYTPKGDIFWSSAAQIRGMDILPSGNIIGSDRLRCSLTIFSHETGAELRVLARGSLNQPMRVVVAKDGYFAVTEHKTHTVAFLDPQGHVIHRVGGPEMLHLPTVIAALPDGRIVGEDQRYRLIVF